MLSQCLHLKIMLSTSCSAMCLSRENALLYILSQTEHWCVEASSSPGFPLKYLPQVQRIYHELLHVHLYKKTRKHKLQVFPNFLILSCISFQSILYQFHDMTHLEPSQRTPINLSSLFNIYMGFGSIHSRVLYLDHFDQFWDSPLLHIAIHIRD